jgi:hypothetical protein
MPVRRLIIHGHFAQPPREDPWLEDVPRDPDAAPDHNWNERVERACYRSVGAARVLNTDAKIARVSNLYAKMSFDAAPSLLEWLERAAPETYRAMLEGDRRAIRRLGVGNAIAHPYHHVILPLCSRRDKVTEVRWGIADFVRRFGRAPAGMWLPETAADDETLDVLAEAGIRFTVVSPHQLDHTPADGGAVRVATSGGREITVIPFDAARSRAVAFGPMLANARIWLADLQAGLETQDAPSVITIATEGETYGHYHRSGEMALAWVLQEAVADPRIAVTNFEAVLLESPPTATARLVGPSSWSCPHGVERWRANCGCRADGGRLPHQHWRATLRTALLGLYEALSTRFETEGNAYFEDVWAARDGYGALFGLADDERRAALTRLCRTALNSADVERAGELLEMQRNLLRSFSSAAWFGDDLGAPEVAQVLRYAARALDLAGPGAGSDELEHELRAVLREARSADATIGSGEDIWVRRVRPIIPPMTRLAAGAAAAQALVPEWEAPSSPAFHIAVRGDRVELVNRRTGRSQFFDVTVQRGHPAEVRTFVRPRPDLEQHPDSGIRIAGLVPVAIDDFPEREAEAVRDGVRRIRRHELARRLFGEPRLAALADGNTTLADLAVDALLDAVQRLSEKAAAVRVARALDLLELLELLELDVPFDAQTIFARELSAMPRRQRDELRPLALRLGFGDEILAVEVV